jgi:hypothetical protein
MKVIELLINTLDEFTGVDAVALVEEPAIQADFFAFNNKEIEDAIAFSLIENAVKDLFVERRAGETREEYISRCIPVLKSEGYGEDQAAAICYDSFELNPTELPDYVNQISSSNEQFESYSDYPESATNAAKRALEWRDSHPDQECGTRVGWARANQLAKREPISEETIARMASFARHLQHEDIPYSEGCGGLMVDAWGGRAGIEWASNKLESIREENSAEKQDFTTEKQKLTFALQEDKQMVVGPLMIPNKLILRIDEQGEPYYVFFSEDTIRRISEKMMRNKYIDKLNLEHDATKPVDGYMVSTWMVEDVQKDKQQLYGFDLPVGTLMGQYKIEDKYVWNKVKSGEIKGFSVEGFFNDKFIQAKKQK